VNTCQTCLFWTPNRPELKAEDGKSEFCLHPKLSIKTEIDFGCTFHCGPSDTAANVPNHLKAASMTDPNPNPIDGPVEILIVTYAKDWDWLVYAMRCARKFLSGFQGITIAHPKTDEERFKTLLHQFDVRLHGYNEVTGKGMLQHFVKMAEADLFLPPSTKYFLTLDADAMFHTHSRPEHFFWQDKPYWIVRTWDSLMSEDPRNPGSKCVSDCYQWRSVTEAQLGFDPELFTMCVNSQAMPISMLKHYREHIESVHKKSFFKYMLEGRNSFPQTRVDFNALGAFAYKFHRDEFHWFDIEKGPFPADRKKVYWSHGGLNPGIVAEIEGFLAK